MNAAIGAVSQRESGAGASLIWVFRQVGGTFGVAILGTVLSSSYRGHLRNLGLPASVSARVDESITAGVAVAHRLGFQGLELLATARTGFVDAMDVVLGVCAAIAVAAAILVWVIPLGGRSRRGEQHTRILTVAGRQDGGTLG
jgi:DHA2 family multidrug resistance protein-like MFS transporter